MADTNISDGSIFSYCIQFQKAISQLQSAQLQTAELEGPDLKNKYIPLLPEL